MPRGSRSQGGRGLKRPPLALNRRNEWRQQDSESLTVIDEKDDEKGNDKEDVNDDDKTEKTTI